MTFKRLRLSLTVVALVASMLSQVTWALAGTTGTIVGSVSDAGTGAPVSGATVTVTSPSQTVSAQSDATGHFTILSLAPDTYTVSVNRKGYTPSSLVGVSVFADQTQALTLKINEELKNVASVTSRSTGNLVKAGTTSDVYSVNARTQQAVAALGGGGNMNNAYSAIYSVPGVTSIINNYGPGQTFHIRGSTYSQIGYEFDGIPVNRAFDNYNSNSLSNLGQQELQVYTGGSPSSASSQTVGGFINQVIKTGTFPGFGNINAGLGAPTFYHTLLAEAGGATPNRSFSWYGGISGYNQSFRQINQQNGANLNVWNSGLFAATDTYPTNTPAFANGLAPCNADGSSPYGPLAASTTNPLAEGDPGCVLFGAGGGYNYNATTSDREGVFNFHIAIPHKNDAARDDIQLLYSTSSLLTGYAESVNDLGGMAGLNAQFRGDYCGNTGRCDASGKPLFQDGYIFAPGTSFMQSASGATVLPYLFPNTGTRLPTVGMDLNQRNTIWNDAGIVKLQYQKNISTNAYARAYVYSDYSDWLQNGPTFGAFTYAAGGGLCCSGIVARDYELVTHTRGGELQFADQINSQHLVTLTANYTTASVMRFNNGTMSNTRRSAATNLTDGTNCYRATTGALASCFSSSTAGTFGAPVGATPPAGSAAALAGATWRVTVPGERGTYNTVTPEFTSLSLTDEYRPNEKLLLNLGLRYEQFKYDLAKPGSDFAFWYNQAANSYCYNVTTLTPLLNPLPPAVPPPASPAVFSGSCPAGYAHPSATDPANTSHLVFSAGNGGTFVNNVVSPRLGLTYTLNPDTVLRATIGRYAEPSKVASTQYLDKSGRNSAGFNFANFWQYGFTTPNHNVKPQLSDNADFSLEKHLKGTDISFRLSPFYRHTTQQQNTIPLGPNFVSDLNVGTQNSYGLELALQKGDVSRNGLSGQLAYTYTKTRIRFSSLSNGRNAIDSINDYIVAFNRLTSSCNGSTAAQCVGTGPHPMNPAAVSPCYAPNDVGAVAAGTCTGAGSTGITNPYYNSAPQPLLDRNGWYDTYSNQFPFQPPSTETTIVPPNTFSGFLNYRHDRLTITPTFQLNQGTSYGSPISVMGYDPRFCAGNQGSAGVKTGDPNKCNYINAYFSDTPNGYLAIPNPLTGKMDGMGEYREPWIFNLNMQLGYDVSSRVHANLVLSNIVNRCFGGSKTPWSTAFPSGGTVCGYAAGGNYYVSNFWNGTGPDDLAANGVGLPNVLKQPYQPVSIGLPFNAYLSVQLKL